jgi:hypothetical protein
LKFLPAVGNRPVPDAEHIVQQLLSLAVVITSTAAYRQIRRGEQIGRACPSG